VNYIDIILIIPIALGAWKGFRKGLIIEVFSLLALFAGIYAGVYFSSFAADFLRDDVKLHSEYIGIGAFLVTFIAVLIAVYYLGKMVSSMVKMASLELVNKLFGALFSSLKALLIMSICLMCLKGLNGKFRIIPEDLMEESLLFEPLSNLPLVVLPAR
jgi:membrane protein required for colicin V production